MARIVTLLLAAAVASFAVACTAPAEETDSTSTSADFLTTTVSERCKLVGAYAKANGTDIPTIKASELPKPVRPRLGLAKGLGKVALGAEQVYMIDDTNNVRFFADDGILIIRGLKKNGSLKWSDTDGEPLTCAPVADDDADKADKDE